MIITHKMNTIYVTLAIMVLGTSATIIMMAMTTTAAFEGD
jgi:hypothetical protein